MGAQWKQAGREANAQKKGQLVNKLEELDVEIEGRTHRCSFALITKVRNYGGDLRIARRVSLLDDQFEVVLFAGQRATRYIKYLTGVAVNRLDGMSGVTILRAADLDAALEWARRLARATTTPIEVRPFFEHSPA